LLKEEAPQGQFFDCWQVPATAAAAAAAAAPPQQALQPQPPRA
jgi:hypothetical protein